MLDLIIVITFSVIFLFESNLENIYVHLIFKNHTLSSIKLSQKRRKNKGQNWGYVKTDDGILQTVLLGSPGGVSFFTYLPTTPSLMLLRSLFFLDNIPNRSPGGRMSRKEAETNQGVNCQGHRSFDILFGPMILRGIRCKWNHQSAYLFEVTNPAKMRQI